MHARNGGDGILGLRVAIMSLPEGQRARCLELVKAHRAKVHAIDARFDKEISHLMVELYRAIIDEIPGNDAMLEFVRSHLAFWEHVSK